MESNVVVLPSPEKKNFQTDKLASIQEKSNHEGDGKMDKNDFITRKELEYLEHNIDLKIKVAVLPIEGKIDNLPTQFKNLLLEERDFQDKQRKETQRYIWGTIIIGLSSIIVSVIFHFI